MINRKKGGNKQREKILTGRKCALMRQKKKKEGGENVEKKESRERELLPG